jgi:hypothetical protein
MGETAESLLNIVNSSGFPLQIRIADEIRKTELEHRWTILAQEHRWTDAQSGNEGFIDLVLEQGGLRIVVECKRVPEGSWVFLLPNPAREVSRTRSLVARFPGTSAPSLEWQDCTCRPEYFETQFCVVRGHSDRDRPMLERLAGVVLRSMESFAEEESRIMLKAKSNSDYKYLYLSAIVTTAELGLCRFNPGDVNLQDGKLEKGAQFDQVSFVQFRKSLATSLPYPASVEDIKEANRENERTVFVIQATGLVAFLKQFKLYMSPK